METHEQRTPIGGDPKDFCHDCDHHEMNHAFYLGMPRACNQTGCECREYAPPVPKPESLPEFPALDVTA